MEKLKMIPKSRFVKIGALAMVAAATLGLSPVLIDGRGGFDQALAHPGNGNGNGHAPAGAGVGAGDSGNASVGQSSQGAVSSALGGLNAAHASKTALSHANPHSRVGKIAAYNRAVQAQQSAAAAAAAQAAANKKVTATVINALNSLLGNK
jgi:hypothetical protein